jgi:hypothetical protein
MNTITANELKTKGASAIKSGSIITIRGKKAYIVLNIEEYDYLRQCELITALKEAKTDLKKGNTIEEPIDSHIARIKNV